MNLAVVFTKDRPAQLNLLVRSIGEFAPDVYDRLRVIDTPPDVLALPVALWTAVEGLDPDEDLVGFHCDDDVFFSETPRPELLDQEFCYSFRLGNTDGGAWEWARHERFDDRGYPFSLDGHVYRAGDVQRIVAMLPLREILIPNDLEHHGCMYVQDHPGEFRPRMARGEHRTMFSCPLNRVQDRYRNATFGGDEWTAEAMRRRWEDGWRLGLPVLEPWQVKGAHFEWTPQWEKRWTP